MLEESARDSIGQQLNWMLPIPGNGRFHLVAREVHLELYLPGYLVLSFRVL